MGRKKIEKEIEGAEEVKLETVEDSSALPQVTEVEPVEPVEQEVKPQPVLRKLAKFQGVK